jgi:predicted Holliday junction resolvase-like endonuclease
MKNHTQQLINELEQSSLFAECCDCGGEFKLSDALLFDGTKKFPTEAMDVQTEYEEDLLTRGLQLKKKLELATKRAQNTTTSVNIGNVVEVILPTLNNYQWSLPDSRFLGKPIDFIEFHGLTAGKITEINFVEIKSGNAKINGHQKAIKKAVHDGQVSQEVFK